MSGVVGNDKGCGVYDSDCNNGDGMCVSFVLKFVCFFFKCKNVGFFWNWYINWCIILDGLGCFFDWCDWKFVVVGYEYVGCIFELVVF